MKDERERFWAKVEKSDGCWLWTGSRLPRGYGHLLFRGRFTGAHRVSWIFANGPIPDGLHILHHCDNPPCVRPDHLYAGTPKDNGRDTVERRRCVQGESHWTRREPERVLRGDRHYLRQRPDKVLRGEALRHCKLTDEAVRQIRDLRLSGLTQRQIAANFGVSQNTVSLVLLGRTWAHV